MNEQEQKSLLDAWQKFAAERSGYPPDGVSQATAALLAESERMLQEMNERAVRWRRASEQSRWR